MATPPTSEGIMQLGFAYWGSKTLLSAVELGLFTALATGPHDTEALTQRLGLHPRGARDFFDALVTLGMVQRDGTHYRNTPATDLYLDRAKPSYIGGALIVVDALIDDERRQQVFGLLMSLHMLLGTQGGFDYTGADCCGWLHDVGFRETRVEPLVGPDAMVVGIK